ncbi:MAG: TIGR03084 family metal-binding protein [Pseudomonadota bacterium]
MIVEADDFLAECDALADLLSHADERILATITQFKEWTIEDVIAHLYMWNVAAAETLSSRETFQTFIAFVMKRMGLGDGHRELQRAWLDETRDGLSGLALLEAWRAHYPGLASAYRDADPEHRVAWAGPDMTAQSKIIARQMEAWAHGQEIFDILGETRKEKDRVRNICHLGVVTYSFAFRNRGMEPQQPKPYVRLDAPSGAAWEWNTPQEDNVITGPAHEFAQIAAQTRNVADTSLDVAGGPASEWVRIIQCFAGAPEDPPPPGSRRRVSA